jgi:hypothetical protein
MSHKMQKDFVALSGSVLCFQYPDVKTSLTNKEDKKKNLEKKYEDKNQKNFHTYLIQRYIRKILFETKDKYK